MNKFWRRLEMAVVGILMVVLLVAGRGDDPFQGTAGVGSGGGYFSLDGQLYFASFVVSYKTFVKDGKEYTQPFVESPVAVCRVPKTGLLPVIPEMVGGRDQRFKNGKIYYVLDKDTAPLEIGAVGELKTNLEGRWTPTECGGLFLMRLFGDWKSAQSQKLMEVDTREPKGGK